MIHGDITSFSVMRCNASCLFAEPRPGCDGWSVMYSYSCGCGDVHHGHVMNAFSTGDDKIHTVQHTCPKQQTENDIELIRTF